MKYERARAGYWYCHSYTVRLYLISDAAKLRRKLRVKQLRRSRVIYEGNMSDAFIQDVRDGKYSDQGVFEGVVCKGIERTGAHRGGIWMCKVKTQKYIDLLKGKFGEKEAVKYGE